MKMLVNGRCVGTIALLSLLLCGCGALRDAGGNLVAGAREELNKPETRDALGGVTEGLGEGVERQIPRLDSLLRVHTRLLVAELRGEALGDSTRRRVGLLRDEILGEATRLHLEALRNELLGEATRRQVGALRNDLLGEATRRQLEALRNELIGEATNEALQVIIDSAVASLAESYKRELRPVLREDVDALRADVEESAGFITRNAKTLVWSLVAGLAVLLAVAGYFVVRALRNRKMLELVTREIDEMGEASRKELTGRIKDRAVETGLEPHLHQLVEDQRRKRAGA